METYTPGRDPSITTFMARRTLASHGAFFGDLLWPGARVLDCGCGPGTMTAGIVDCVLPEGFVAAIDVSAQQVEAARERVGERGVDLRVGSVYELPFAEGTFDAVFSHALFEHLGDPVGAARQLHRVLRPGGILGICSPDWDGKLAGPPEAGVSTALEFYADMQAANGGDLRIGKKLGSVVRRAGFGAVRTRCRYECYEPVRTISEYLAQQLATAGAGDHAATLRAWPAMNGAFFAQAWCETVARKL